MGRQSEDWVGGGRVRKGKERKGERVYRERLGRARLGYVSRDPRVPSYATAENVSNATDGQTSNVVFRPLGFYFFTFIQIN